MDSNRDAQIRGFIQRLNSDAILARHLQQNPLAAVHAAGFDVDAEQPVSLYMATIPTCLDPPETNHYLNR